MTGIIENSFKTFNVEQYRFSLPQSFNQFIHFCNCAAFLLDLTKSVFASSCSSSDIFEWWWLLSISKNSERCSISWAEVFRLILQYWGLLGWIWHQYFWLNYPASGSLFPTSCSFVSMWYWVFPAVSIRHDAFRLLTARIVASSFSPITAASSKRVLNFLRGIGHTQRTFEFTTFWVILLLYDFCMYEERICNGECLPRILFSWINCSKWRSRVTVKADSFFFHHLGVSLQKHVTAQRSFLKVTVCYVRVAYEMFRKGLVWLDLRGVSGGSVHEETLVPVCHEHVAVSLRWRFQIRQKIPRRWLGSPFLVSATSFTVIWVRVLFCRCSRTMLYLHVYPVILLTLKDFVRSGTYQTL